MPAPAQLASRPNSLRSITWTDAPCLARSQASDNPMTPPPMIKTSCIASTLIAWRVAQQFDQPVFELRQMRIVEALEVGVHQQRVQRVVGFHTIPCGQHLPRDLTGLEAGDG